MLNTCKYSVFLIFSDDPHALIVFPKVNNYHQYQFLIYEMLLKLLCNKIKTNIH